MNNKKNILITGGSGYIGSFISNHLYNTKLYNIDIIDLKKPIFNNFNKFIKLDLSKKIKLKKKNNYHLIIHLASNTLPRESITNVSKYIFDNLMMTINILNNFKFNKFIFFSTANLYKPNLKINEQSVIEPQSPYGESKLVIENYLKWVSNNNNSNYCIFRLFNAVGGDPYNKFFVGNKIKMKLLIPTIFQKYDNNEIFQIFGNDYNTDDGTCIRDLIHVYDIANAIIKYDKLGKANKFEIFNIGSGNKTSVLEIVNFIKEKYIPKLKFKYAPKQYGDPSKITCNPNKAKKVLNWKPEYSSLKSIVESYISSFK